MTQCGTISVKDQLANEKWCRGNQLMRTYFMEGGGVERFAPSAAVHFAKVLRDPLRDLDTDDA